MLRSCDRKNIEKIRDYLNSNNFKQRVRNHGVEPLIRYHEYNNEFRAPTIYIDLSNNDGNIIKDLALKIYDKFKEKFGNEFEVLFDDRYQFTTFTSSLIIPFNRKNLNIIQGNIENAFPLSAPIQKLTQEEKAKTIEQITKLKSSIQIFDKNSNNKNFDSSNLKDDDLALMLFNQALGLNLTSINQLTWENIKDNIFFEKEDGSLGVKNLAFTSGNLLSTKKATLSDFLNQKGLFPEYKVFIGESVIYPNVFETLQTENDAIKKAVFENLFNLSGAFEQVKKELNNHSSETFIIETPDGKFTFSKRFAAGFWNIASKVELLLKENQSSYIQDYLASKKEKEEVTRDGKKVKPEITKTLTVNDTIVQNAIGLIGNPIIENAIKNNTSVKIQVFSNAEYSEDGIAGWFLPASNTIYLHESMLKPQHLSEGLPLIAHELIHSVTEQSLQFDKNFQREIQSLLDRVKSQSEIKDFYGFKNTSEFLSEAFSSQEFRQLLKDTQFSNTENLSVWQKFVNAILKLFGKNTKYSEKTIVTNAEQILNSIINQHSYKIGFVNSKISDKIYSNTKIDYSKLTAEEKAKTIEQLFNENPELANEVYSKILTNSGISAENLLSLLEKENIVEKDCTGGGKLKAEKGLQTNFTKGGKWRLIKDLKGYPTHKEGGVDLTIGKNGVSIKNGDTEFTAKHGLVIPKN